MAIAPPSPTFGVAERFLFGAPVAVALLCAMIGRQVLVPRLATLNSGDQEQAFERMHRTSAMLNTVALSMLVLALAAVSGAR